ncbi:MAG: biotin-dependent carboxyltransferase family protein [Desulforhopalus sp.]|nr:biotin-dependent carboxyltransferase family protein [Desulforhopalus sp.]
MSALMKVTEGGFCTTVQDLGRFGCQAMAVPVCGVRDADALRLANRLVGNEEGMEGLDIIFSGPAFEVATDSVRIALAGAEVALEIEVPGAKKKRLIPAGESVRLERGTRFAVGSFSNSFCCVLAVEGGFAVEKILGSRCTCLAGKFGGFEGRRLQAGDSLPLELEGVVTRPERLLAGWFYRGGTDGSTMIRVVPGPQEEYFTAEAREIFYASRYTVTAQSNSMGLRLEGPALRHSSRGFNLVSDGIVTGSIQVPGNGMPIILFNDHQITGGYPKIATVISSDLSTLGRLGPGAEIFFKPLTAAAAEQVRRNHEHHFQQMCGQICEVQSSKEALALRLAACNLLN